jgi:S-adenosylhomocysteine hydrolase
MLIAPDANITKSRQAYNALSSTTPCNFPQLPVTAYTSKNLQTSKILKARLKKTVLVFVQHLLETTGSLLIELEKCGIPFQNMHGKGKCYSTCQSVAEGIKALGVNLLDEDLSTPVQVGQYQNVNREKMTQLWLQVERYLFRHPEVENVIIVDEGGRCVEAMPEHIIKKYNVSAVEQTRGGLYSPAIQNAPFPIVLLATSAIKQQLEPDLIADVILKKLEILICNRQIPNNAKCGVIGNGAIGKAVVRYLIKAKLDVFVFDLNPHSFGDINPSNFTRVNSVESLLKNSQIIFGCTGRDSLANIPNLLDIIDEDKFFVSCSSEDREFYSLIQHSNTMQKWLNVVTIQTENSSKVTVLNGGFPINFDQSPKSVPKTAIDLTRALLLASVAQASTYTKSHQKLDSQLLMLTPKIQQNIAGLWLSDRFFMSNYPNVLIENMHDESWIQENSSGYYDESKIEELF